VVVAVSSLVDGFGGDSICGFGDHWESGFVALVAAAALCCGHVMGLPLVGLVLFLFVIGIVGTIGHFGNLGHSQHLATGLVVVFLVLAYAWAADSTPTGLGSCVSI
jgi:hypothetical protein